MGLDAHQLELPRNLKTRAAVSDQGYVLSNFAGNEEGEGMVLSGRDKTGRS